MDNEPNSWAIGWTAFAMMMMVLGGTWWIFAGIVALVNDTFYVVGPEYIVQFDVTTWGWIHVLLGIVILLSAIGLFSGAVWGTYRWCHRCNGVGTHRVCVAALVAVMGGPPHNNLSVRHLVADRTRTRPRRHVAVGRTFAQLLGTHRLIRSATHVSQSASRVLRLSSQVHWTDRPWRASRSR